MPGEKFWGIVKEDRNKISGKNTIGIVITFWDFLEEDRKGILKMSYPHLDNLDIISIWTNRMFDYLNKN